MRASSAANAAGLLQGDEPGVLLVGPAAQTSYAIRLILNQLSDRSVMPIGFMASGATPEMLRQEVGQAHAARPSPDTDLLLVVAQADRLSPDLLHELEMAAEAAATHGGLKFLFAAPRDLSASLQRAELWSLAACVRARVPVLPPTPPSSPQGAPQAPPGAPLLDTRPEHDIATSSAQVSERPYPFNLVAEPLGVARHTRQARPVPRVMLAVGILALLGLSVAGILAGHQPNRPPAPIAPVAQTPPPAPSTIKLPLVPDAVPPAPSPSSTTPSSEPGIQAPPIAAAPVHESPAPAAPTPPLVVAPPVAPPPALAPLPEAATASPVAPVPSPQPTGASPVTVPPVSVPPSRVDAGRIVPQLAPARHASLLLLAGPSDTLPSLYAEVYRGITPPPYAQVETLNPVVRSGVRLVFPAPPTGWPAASPPP